MSTPSDFVPFHALVTAPGAAPAAWMLVLHGILGSGANFRTFARRVVEARPAWGLILVDLRAHGQSQDPPPPHTLDAAAADLDRLVAHLGLDVRGVMGHSFGGKVALAYVALRARGGAPLERAFVLDSDPGARPDGPGDFTSRQVLELLEALPQPLPTREAFFEYMASRGITRRTTDWLAMNVRRAEDGFRLRLDLPAIRALLEDYFTRDLWPAVVDPSGVGHIELILGGRSDSVPADSRQRLEDLSARSPHLGLRVLPEAGHWVHVDDPDGLLAAVIERL